MMFQKGWFARYAILQRRQTLQKSYCSGLAQGEQIPREAILISQYMGGDFDSFYWNIKEKAHSLLMFDMVNVDEGISSALREEIERDGIVLYEKA